MTQLTLPVSERDRLTGRDNAPVTLLEYGDYQCSHCRQAHLIVKQIQKQLGDSLRFVFRYFPLTSINKYAQYAAEVAEAAGTQGRFWEMHNYLFEYQLSLGNGDMLQYAAYLGLDIDRFEREIAEHVYAKRVREDLKSGIKSGVNGLPTFFINGLRYNGACDRETLLATIVEVIDSQPR